MSRKLIGQIKKAYQIPEPLQKDSFLQKMPKPEMSCIEFVKSQIGYIHKRNWVFAGLIFLLFLGAARWSSPDRIQLFAALLPFLALITVSEGSRSLRCGMSEMERSTRFSLQSVILARMGSLGIVNLILLLILFPLFTWKGHFGVFKAGVLILVPYLLTSAACLRLVRRVRVQESIYYCGAFTCGICGLQIIIMWIKIPLISVFTPQGCLVLVLFLIFMTGKEFFGLLKNMEDGVWN